MPNWRRCSQPMYEVALVGNDVERLDALFWASESTVRYGAAESRPFDRAANTYCCSSHCQMVAP